MPKTQEKVDSLRDAGAKRAGGSGGAKPKAARTAGGAKVKVGKSSSSSSSPSPSVGGKRPGKAASAAPRPQVASRSSRKTARQRAIEANPIVGMSSNRLRIMAAAHGLMSLSRGAIAAIRRIVDEAVDDVLRRAVLAARRPTITPLQLIDAYNSASVTHHTFYAPIGAYGSDGGKKKSDDADGEDGKKKARASEVSAAMKKMDSVRAAKHAAAPPSQA